MTYRYRVELRLQSATRWRAREVNTGVDLGLVVRLENEKCWYVAHLAHPDRDGLSRLATLEAVRLELERYCRANPDEIDAGYRAILAARGRATSPEPVDTPAPEQMQGAML